MKDIFIIQMHTGTIPSIIIKLFTRYKYSHVLIATNSSFDKMYSFGRKKLFNPFNAGFVIENIDGDFFRRFNKTMCRIYKILISEEKYDNVIKLLNYFEDNKNQYKYDIIGLFLKTMSLPIKREKHYVCTQFVAEILETAHIYEFGKSNLLVKPKDFEKIDNSKEIYSGLLKDTKKLLS